MPSGAPGALLVRPSAEADLGTITRIYAHAVATGTASFELEPPDEPEMARRRAELLSDGLPYLVAEQDGQVLGYAYAGRFRPRRAYRFSLENSIYLDAAARGKGVGRLLLAELMARCQALGARQMVAVIGDSANLASIGLHRAAGFEHTGTLKNVGRKFDRWLDVVMMQRELGAGATLAPNS